MIDISLIQLVMLYLFAVVGLVGAVWWLGGRARRAHWKREASQRIACRACGNVFPDRSLAELSVCPHCGRPNERVA